MVPGEGPQPALGMIVGEAPGKQEVAEGRPFVGKSGKLLETALRAFGVSRNDEVYITNVVKEMSTDSQGKIRRPYSEEIEAWEAVLDGEIENTAPAAILTLGRVAAEALTGYQDVPFGSKIGNVYVAWHPAYVLRSRGAYRDWLEQIKPWAEALRAA